MFLLYHFYLWTYILKYHILHQNSMLITSIQSRFLFSIQLKIIVRCIVAKRIFTCTAIPVFQVREFYFFEHLYPPSKTSASCKGFLKTEIPAANNKIFAVAGRINKLCERIVRPICLLVHLTSWNFFTIFSISNQVHKVRWQVFWFLTWEIRAEIGQLQNFFTVSDCLSIKNRTSPNAFSSRIAIS